MCSARQSSTTPRFEAKWAVRLRDMAERLAHFNGQLLELGERKPPQIARRFDGGEQTVHYRFLSRTNRANSTRPSACGAEWLERPASFVDQSFGVFSAFRDAEDSGKRELSVGRILADPLSQRRFVAADIQQIVGDLECQTQPRP